MKEEMKALSVYEQICARLAMFGFKPNCNGGMYRLESGCLFYLESLSKYKSFEAFLEDYSCYEVKPQLN